MTLYRWSGFNILWINETSHPNLARAPYPPSETTTSTTTDLGLARKDNSKHHAP